MKFKSFITVIILFFSINLFAIPADKTPITIKQPNGKMLTYVLQGDERISWAKTLDEYSLLTNKEGNWVYAMIDKKGDMVPSKVLACNKDERSKSDLKFLKDIKPNLFYSQSQTDAKLNREDYSKEKPKKRWWRFWKN